MNKKYDVRNMDLIEGLDLRIQKLREMKYDDLANQQLSFIFNGIVEAYEKLNHAGNTEKKRLKEVKTIFDRHFKEMMIFPGYTIRQKIKIAIFRVSPSLYIRFDRGGL